MNEYRVTLRDADKDNQRTQNPTTKSWIIKAGSWEEAEKIIIDLAKMYFAGAKDIRYTFVSV